MTFTQRVLSSLARPVIEYMSRNRLPQLSGQLKLHGLSGPVVIRRDTWGVPHVQATSRADMYFAQGVLHAQDRLWQMELSRRVAKGEMGAIIGPDALPLDRLARTLGFARLGKGVLQRLTEETQSDLAAYTQGVNAYLDTQPPLPIEFRLLGIEATPWEISDTSTMGFLQGWVLSRGWSGEMVRAQLINKLGPELFQELDPRYPADNPQIVPEGLENIELLTSRAMRQAGSALLGKGRADGGGIGSNSWVIAKERSASGHPILANDPHLPLTTPSIWYLVDQQYRDGHHVSGVSLPGFPYVLIGHNEHIAWGITLSYADCEDLVVEKLKPQETMTYQYGDAWRTAQVIEEVIEVKGEAAHSEHVIVTHHGPIISETLLHTEHAIVLQSVSLQENLAFQGFAELNDAHDWESFRTAVGRVEITSLSISYADRMGNIGFAMSGRIPLRAPGESGLRPTIGWTGKNDWQGFVPTAEMPATLNPKTGYLIACNNKIIDTDSYPYYLGNVWMNGFRARRLHELISGNQAPITLDDCQRWHLDTISIPARELVAYLSQVEITDPEARISYDMLVGWDGDLAADSRPAAVYQVLRRKLSERLLGTNLRPAEINQLLGLGPNPVLYPVSELYGYWDVTLLQMLAHPNSRWMPGQVGLQAVWEACLRETTRTLIEMLGEDPVQWTWGRLHPIRFPHALGVNPVMDPIFSLGGQPIGGDTNTVLQAAVLVGEHAHGEYDADAFSVSYRQIFDLGDWDNSRFIMPPGQSGQLGSPHYSDMLDDWLAGELHPMVWSEAQVARVTQYQLMLVPG